MEMEEKKQSKFMEIILAIIHAISKATTCIDGCVSAKKVYGGGDCRVTKVSSRIPTSFNVNSPKARIHNDEDSSELARLLSKRRGVSGTAAGSNTDEQMQGGEGDCSKTKEMKRGYSTEVGKIGRIDEEKTCSFEEPLSSVHWHLVYCSM